MTTQQMRDKLREYFYSDKWNMKLNKMSDSQVQAIYFRLSREGKIK